MTTLKVSTNNIDKVIRAMKRGYTRKTADCVICGKRVGKTEALQSFGSLGTYYYHNKCLS